MFSRMRAAMYSSLKFVTLAVVLSNLLDFSYQLERREKRGYNSYQDDGDNNDDDDSDRRRQIAAYQRSQDPYAPRYFPDSRRQLARDYEAQAALMTAQQREPSQRRWDASQRRGRRAASHELSGLNYPMMNQLHRQLAMDQMMGQRSHIMPKHMPMESAAQLDHKPMPVEAAEQLDHRPMPVEAAEQLDHRPMPVEAAEQLDHRPMPMPVEAAEQMDHKPMPVEAAEQKDHESAPMEAAAQFMQRDPRSRLNWKRNHPMRQGNPAGGGISEPLPGYWGGGFRDLTTAYFGDPWRYGNNTDDPSWVDRYEGPLYGNNAEDPEWRNHFKASGSRYGRNDEDPTWWDSHGGWIYGRNEEDPNWRDPYPQPTTRAVGVTVRRTLGPRPTLPTTGSFAPTTATVTPAVTATVTPAVTATVTPAVTATVTPAVTATVTPAVTATVTPAVTAKQEAEKQSAEKSRQKANQVCPTRACQKKDVASKCQCVPKAGIPWSHHCISMKAADPCCEKWAVARCPEVPVF